MLKGNLVRTEPYAVPLRHISLYIIYTLNKFVKSFATPVQYTRVVEKALRVL